MARVVDGITSPVRKKVIRSWDVITCFVPVVRQAQQGQVREIYADEEQREDEPEGQRAVERYWLSGKYGHESLLLFPANII